MEVMVLLKRHHMVGIKYLQMKLIVSLAVCLLFLSFISCRGDEQIIHLLNSSDKEDVILGAYKAGESSDIKFVPLLLQNANDPRISTNIQFKGISVYQAKMGAVRKILKQDPPVALSYKPDSTIIIFYTQLWSKMPK
jgi:hypothetical protein